MRWRGRRQSSNIDDRRGRGRRRSPAGGGGIRIPVSGRRGGLGGLVLIVVIVVVAGALGIDPVRLLGGGPATVSAPPTQSPARDDATTQFVATVLAETEDVWNAIFAEAGGEPLDAPERVPVSLNSWTTLRNIDGTFRIRLSAAPQAGNWIWLDAPDTVSFVLTLIDTPTAASVSMVELDMPKIEKIGCRDA